MEVLKIKCASGNEYTIINESWQNSRNWGHKSTLYSNYEISKNKVTYYNRTWESYVYKSCMSCLISSLLQKNLNSFITEYKEINNINRLTKAKKEQAIEKWEQKEYIKDLKEIQQRIRDRKFD